MTLDQIVKMQSIIDKRAIRCDTLEFLIKQDIHILNKPILDMEICT